MTNVLLTCSCLINGQYKLCKNNLEVFKLWNLPFWPLSALSCIEVMSDACALVESDAYMSKDLGRRVVTEHPPCTYSYFCHTLAALVAFLGINCDAAWRHGGTYTGVICDLGWSLVNMVLLHWSRQSDSQSASQPASLRKKRHAARKGAWLNGGKTSIPFSQSQSTETLNDAGSLQRPAGWNWVKEDPMSHWLH